jgi:hypothetical protein
MEPSTVAPQVAQFRVSKPATDRAGAGALTLELEVSDPEVVEMLRERPEGSDRNTYATDALRIGLLALRHANSRLDADQLRHETTRLLESLDAKLSSYSRQSHERMQSTLSEYFDPKSGRFSERVERLVADDGELPRILRQHMAGDESQLARTLTSHIGRDSPLMRMLSPDQSTGLLESLRKLVEQQLASQSKRVLDEFSLDNEQGALRRLVGELTEKHGSLSRDLREKIDEVVQEFSLDAEDSALNRLKKKLDEAHRTITGEFSLNNEHSAFSQLKRMLETTQGSINSSLTLDEEGSPLARLKRELMTILQAHVETNAEFQEKVMTSLAKLTQRRETEAQTTLHGHSFEQAVYDFLSRDCQTCGHIIEATGNRTGLKQNCKKGDIVVTLTGAAQQSVKVVFEAKEDQGYNVARALAELDEARANRGAEVGVFVFSRKSAAADLLPLKRYGKNVIVVWDAENPDSDSYLHAAFEFAKAYCADRGRQAAVGEVDFEAVEKAMLAIEKTAGNLEEIGKHAQSVVNSGTKILKRVEIDRGNFEKQIALLRELAERIHAAVASQ